MTAGWRYWIETQAFWLTRLFVFAVCAAIYVDIMVMNDGKLMYVLDDPYIHLSVSESIWHGGYGVNPGEFASPSSSVLFPFLLTIGAFSRPFHEYVPFIYGLLSLFATIEILRVFLRRIGLIRDPASNALAAGFVALALLFFNVIGIVFTGMEHNIHVLLTATAILGLVVFLEERRLPWWFVASVGLLPLIRYEGLALSVPILFCLAWRGAWKTALGLAVFIFGVLGAFSAFLISHGLPFLPGSVLAKSTEMAAAADGTSGGILASVIETTRTNIGLAPGVLLGLCAVLACAVLWSDLRHRTVRNETLVALVLLGFTAGQDVAGQFGWWGRYEVYAFVGATMMVLYLVRTALAGQLVTAATRSRLAVGAVALLALIGFPYMRTLALSSLSANNIYEQDYVVHRFLVETLRGPAAIHDLGLASYGNDNYVFDMLGLGSEEARRAKPPGDLMALNPLIKAHGIKLAVLYRDWWLKNTPPDWQCVGQLHLSRKKGSPARSMIEFCAVEPKYADEIRRLLREFKPKLPPRVRLDILG